MDLRSAVLSSLFVFLVTAVLLYHRVTKRIPKQPRPEESRSKGPVFRVTGLPASKANDALDTTLKAAIDDKLSEEERSKLNITIAILPSCYDKDQDKIALVEFRGGVPTFLSKLVANPQDNWQGKIGDTDIISIDQHFFGFTQLYTPKLDAPVTAE